MPRRYHLSRYVSQTIACWLEVSLHRVDTHAYLSASLCWKDDREQRPHKDAFFRDWVCDSSVLFDWIKRGVITRVDPAPRSNDENLQADAWAEIQETLEACRPFLSIPLTADAVERDERYRQPDQELWYEVVVDRLSDAGAGFELSLWGYKYALTGLSAPRDVFYILTDRLGARVRLRPSWSALEPALAGIRLLLPRNSTLARVRAELEQELVEPGLSTEPGVDKLLRSLFPLFERMLRYDATARGWSTHGLKLDAIVRKLENANVLSDDSRQMAALVTRPYRDVILHGRRLTLPVARVVLVALLDCFERFARELDVNPGIVETPPPA